MNKFSQCFVSRLLDDIDENEKQSRDTEKSLEECISKIFLVVKEQDKVIRKQKKIIQSYRKKKKK